MYFYSARLSGGAGAVGQLQHGLDDPKIKKTHLKSYLFLFRQKREIKRNKQK